MHVLSISVCLTVSGINSIPKDLSRVTVGGEQKSGLISSTVEGRILYRSIVQTRMGVLSGYTYDFCSPSLVPSSSMFVVSFHRFSPSFIFSIGFKNAPYSFIVNLSRCQLDSYLKPKMSNTKYVNDSEMMR